MIAALRGVSNRQLCRQLRRGLDDVCHKVLAKSPEDRYTSVSSFRSDVLNDLQRRPVSASRSRKTLASFIRRQPILATLGFAITSAALAAAIVAIIFLDIKTREATQRSLDRRQRLQEQESELLPH